MVVLILTTFLVRLTKHFANQGGQKSNVDFNTHYTMLSWDIFQWLIKVFRFGCAVYIHSIWFGLEDLELMFFSYLWVQWREGRCVWKLKERRLERRVIGDRCDRYGRSGVRVIRTVRAKPRKLGTSWTETSTTDHRRWTPDVGISNIICSVFFSFHFSLFESRHRPNWKRVPTTVGYQTLVFPVLPTCSPKPA